MLLSEVVLQYTKIISIVWFYRHTGEQLQSGANNTEDFIGMMENSLRQEQTILAILSQYWRTASVRSKQYWWFYRYTREQPKTRANNTGDFIAILENSFSQEQTILMILSVYWRAASTRVNYWRFYRHTGEQLQSAANYTNDFSILENSLRQEQTILAVISAYWRQSSIRSKLYWCLHRYTGKQSQTRANYTGDLIGILESSIRQEQTILIVFLIYWRTASDKSELYWRFYRYTGELAQTRANCTDPFIGVLESSLRQEQTIQLLQSLYWWTDKSNLYWCFYRYTREQLQRRANNTDDFIGILEKNIRQDFIDILDNSFSQEQTILMILSAYWRTAQDKSKLYWRLYQHTGEQPHKEQTILVILSTYWRTASVRSKLYWWFYRYTGEQPLTRANYTGDFIDILENSFSQEQTILVILLVYWRTASDKSKLFWGFYRYIGEQSQSVISLAY